MFNSSTTIHVVRGVWLWQYINTIRLLFSICHLPTQPANQNETKQKYNLYLNVIPAINYSAPNLQKYIFLSHGNLSQQWRLWLGTRGCADAFCSLLFAVWSQPSQRKRMAISFLQFKTGEKWGLLNWCIYHNAVFLVLFARKVLRVLNFVQRRKKKVKTK